MDQFAVITTGGKQYKVAPGSKIKVEKIAGAAGEKVAFEVLLKADKDDVKIGAPHLDGKAEGVIVRQFRDEKKIIFKYSPKSRTRRKKGHRQEMTEVEIKKI
jgi:large subunit ribosomal protein L21